LENYILAADYNNWFIYFRCLD